MAIAGDSSYNPVTQTADSQEILTDCIFQLKLTAGKASGKISALLTVDEREVTKSDRSAPASQIAVLNPLLLNLG